MKKINFLLAITFLFLSSCQNPMSPPQPPEPSIPAGKGLFTLVISDVNGRTILPNTTLSSFAEFSLEFFPEGGGAPIRETRKNTTPGASVILNVGKYNLQVTAYMSAGDGKPAAYGELLNIEIIEGQINTGSVSLKAITLGTGTFRWDITFSSGLILKEASMTINSLDPESGFIEKKFDLLKGDTNILELESGYYNVLTTLIKDDETQSIKRWDILHIYQNLESVFTFMFSDSDFYRKNYIVTFVYDNGLDNGIQTCDLDAKITKPPDPNKTGYIFGAWYTDEKFSNEWDFSKGTVTGDMSLYAKWLTAGKFTFEFVITDHSPVVDSGITITSGMSADIKVKNDSEFDVINWYYNGNSLGNGGTLALDSSKLGSVSGYRFITVEAIKADGARYSALVMVKVQAPAARIDTKFYVTLADAIKDVPNTGTTVSSPTEIILLSNVTTNTDLPSATTGYSLNSGQHILITVETDCNMSINSSAGGFALFTVNSGASLTLDGSKGSLTLSGGGLTATESRRGIYINNGTVIINDNVTIAGFRNSTSSTTSDNYGGGVYVTGASASFTMNGGTIYGSGSDVPTSQQNTAYSFAAIYIYSGTAKYGGRYGTANITSTNDTLPALSGTITINTGGSVSSYTRLYAVYSGSETVSYQWRYSSSSSSSGTIISGATTPTHIPVNSGYYTVTVSAPGYASKTSSSVTINDGNLAGKIIITPNGRIEPNTTLTASYNGTEPAANNVAITYQWRREANDTSVASTSTYAPSGPGIYTVTVNGAGYNENNNRAAGNIVAYILPEPEEEKITPLSNNMWIDGTFTGSDPQDWYSIDFSAGVSPDTTYRVWVNNGNCTYGDGTKTVNTKLSIIYDDGKIVYLDQIYSSSWSGVPFTPASDFTGKVYIQVKPSSSSLGTYAVVYSTEATRPKNNTLDLLSNTPTTLAPGVWKQETLSSTSPQHWYSFSVSEGSTYNLWWNEFTPYYLSNISVTINGISLITDVDVTAWYEDNTEAFANTDTAWAAPKSFTAEKTGTVTLQIRPNSASSSYGAYEIVYSESNTRPGGHMGVWTAPAYTPLISGAWTDGNLTSTSQQYWYSFYAPAAGTYYVWWNDYYYGNDSSKTAYVYVAGCYSDGRLLFSDITGGSRTITVDSPGTIYLRVRYYSRTGSYGITFSTTNSRPQL